MSLNTHYTEVADPQNKPTHPILETHKHIERDLSLHTDGTQTPIGCRTCEQATVTQLTNASHMVDMPSVCREPAPRRRGVE
eukprot:8430267-Alexandrium_andersonii.AAC.1